MSSPEGIVSFFEDKTVFVTGATGFLGAVLVEKLLRSCPGIRGIYLLIRKKKEGQGVDKRLAHIFSMPLFASVPAELKAKVSAVEGDVALEDAGLSKNDKEKVLVETQVVFHVAAYINFNAGLGRAVRINVQGTSYILDLANIMPNIRVFVYTSTAYCNCTHSDVLLEKVYPSKWAPREFMKHIESLSTDEVAIQQPRILGSFPNSYVFSKLLAENLITSERGNMPVAIVRPTIGAEATLDALIESKHTVLLEGNPADTTLPARFTNSWDETLCARLKWLEAGPTTLQYLDKFKVLKVQKHAIPLFKRDFEGVFQHRGQNVIQALTDNITSCREAILQLSEEEAKNESTRQYELKARITELITLCTDPDIATVMGSLKSPMPGWVDNVSNGAVGFIAGAGRGVFRSIHGDGSKVADIVPCDQFANLLVASAWDVANTGGLKVYHHSSGYDNPITWSDYVRLSVDGARKYPCTRLVFLPRAKLRSSKVWHDLYSLFAHYIPAFFFDFVVSLKGIKPELMDIQNRYFKGMQYTSFFTFRQWVFDKTNVDELAAKLTETEKEEFDFDTRHIDWPSYMESCVHGLRKYFHREPDRNLPLARIIYQIWCVVDFGHHTLMLLIISAFFFLLSNDMVFSALLGIIFLLLYIWF